MLSCCPHRRQNHSTRKIINRISNFSSLVASSKRQTNCKVSTENSDEILRSGIGEKKTCPRNCRLNTLSSRHFTSSRRESKIGMRPSIKWGVNWCISCWKFYSVVIANCKSEKYIMCINILQSEIAKGRERDIVLSNSIWK